MDSRTYRPDIDGLRAIAVLSVVFFHLTGYGGGFIGVDIFFVISGYLISTIIFREVDENRFSIVRFYERRVRRIFPALIVVVLFTALIFGFFAVPIDYKNFAQSVGATGLFVSNILFLLKNDYFDSSSELAPLLHTWSLAVEEQYYLVFPLLAVLVGRLLPSRRVEVLGAIAVVSLVLSIYVVRANANWAFYMPFSRFWELLVGAILAAAPFRRPLGNRSADIVGGLGLVALAISIVFYNSHMLFPGESALLPCLGSVAVILAGRNERAISRRILQLPPIVFVGLISYSLYLWHWPILVGTRYILFGDLDTIGRIGIFIIMLVVAYLSWRFVEQPVRRARWISSKMLFSGALASIVVSLGFAAVVQASGGLPQRLPLAARNYAAAALDINPRRAECDRPTADKFTNGTICIVGDPAAPGPSFAFVGDSFGDALMPAIDAAARQQHRKGYALIHSGCFTLYQVDQTDPACREFMDRTMDFIGHRPELVSVVIAARWTSAYYGNRFGQTTGDDWFITDSQSKEKSTIENRGVFRRGLVRVLDGLAPRKITLIAHIPEQQYDVPRALAMNALLGTPAEIPITRQVHDERQAPVRAIFADLAPKHPFDVIDLGKNLCDAAFCAVQHGDVVLYVDDNHLSRHGAMQLVDALRPAFPPLSGANPPSPDATSSVQ